MELADKEDVVEPEQSDQTVNVQLLFKKFQKAFENEKVRENELNKGVRGHLTAKLELRRFSVLKLLHVMSLDFAKNEFFCSF